MNQNGYHQKIYNNKCWRGYVEKRKLLPVDGNKVNIHEGEQNSGSLQTKQRSTIGPSNPITGHRSSSVQFSHSVVSDSLRLHESQHARPPCPSPTTGVHSDSRPSSLWYHPAISSCCALLLLPSIPPSIRVFSNESTHCMRWPKYWSFSFSIIPSKEIPGLISFRMDWLDLLAVQGTLKSLL